MGNVIKYTTTPVNNSIKKGNFALGINDIDYGPTNITGFYSTTIPSTSGYTVYNENGGTLSYESVSGTTPLINYLSNKRGVLMTTAGESLSWAAGQSNIFVTNREYENIVTSGMVLNLDAGFVSSYPTSATTWYDLSYSGNNGTLTNGPTFSSLSGGSIVFDGVDDYCVVNSSSNSSLSGNFSITQWYRAATNDGGYRILFETNGYRTETLGIAIYQFGSYFRIWRVTPGYRELITTSSNTVGLNVWKTFTLVRNNGVFNFYIDTVLSGTYSTDTNNYSDTSYHIGGDGPPTSIYWFQGNIATTQIYNRALSASEVQQNFNALRGRYGI